jgi:aminopeptidase N|nr:M1 family metallopeptidase [Allomuricauda sp.]
MKQYCIVSAFILGLCAASAQNFTRQDTLRGSITPERAWWDLNYYDLNVKVEPEKKFISGHNVVRYKVLNAAKVLQIDLQEPMQVTSVTQEGLPLEVLSEGNAHFITLKKEQVPGEFNTIDIHFSGYPREAVRAPWDGGFSWKEDTKGNPFVATSCQGLGASVWWPNKDHMYDEVDSMRIRATVPKDLMDISNGKLEGVENDGEFKTYNWFVANPINNYGVNVNIGNYVHFGEKYEGEKGTLDVDYYVLPENLEKAKEQFKQTPMMLKAFEHWFGPYPFYEDGFKLVEVPYLGMEHQSSVTYGNQYANGYLGRDLSGSGWGLKFDFIIIHEAGHEWFANNITYKDIADMWIHEGFTAYSENLYLDYHYGSKAASEYVVGTRNNIQNDRPIIGAYGVNQAGSGDMYYKGANMLHTLRQLIEDDELWRQILRGLNSEFYHKTVTTQQIEDYISEKTKKDLSAFFNQYLRTTMIPKFEYQQNGSSITYRYVDIVEDFDMPIRVFVDGNEQWLFPNSEWKTESLKGNELIFDPNFYIETQKI